MLKSRSLTSAAAVLVWFVSAVAPAQPVGGAGGRALPSDSEIRKLLAERVDAIAGDQDSIGFVIGVVEPTGRRIISYGHLDRGDARALDGDTVFEIGSVGKLFTALLLADMAGKGDVALADPVAKYLPAGAKIPQRNGRSITLLDLATHTSGLPFMPDAYPVVDDPTAPPFATAELYQFLARYQLTRDPGTDWDYSNVGYWLLGQALASRGGQDFASLLQARVLAPLNLRSTAVTVSLARKARMAVGHNAVLGPAPPLDAVSIYSAMGPAIGSVVSTANDLLTFVSVALGYGQTPLSSSMRAMLATRRPIAKGTDQALGWVVMGQGDTQLITHEGGSWGFVSFVAWDPSRRVGVVVLSNQTAGVSDLALHLLRPEVPLEKQSRARHVEIALEPALLDAYAGRYESEDEGEFTILRERDYLRLQLPVGWGLPRFRLRAESRSDFFVAELPVRVTLQADNTGRVTGALVYPPRGQRGIPAKRVK